jgi:hypothetical protein
MDVRSVDVPPQILKLVPHRLADQFTVLPITTKEPKSLVLAMSDPSDLNAIDSARFASGLNIEPVVASHSALRKAISDLYRRVEPPPGALMVEVGNHAGQEDALPVTFSLEPLPLPAPPASTPPRTAAFPRDPFFDGATAPTQPVNIDPFGLFENNAPPRPAAPAVPSNLVPERTITQQVRRLESYHTRALVLGLVRLFQRRGIIGQDELQRLLTNLVESGEIKDDDKID